MGPGLPSDHPSGNGVLIGDDARETRVSQRVTCIPWLLVDVLPMKAAELKRTGVLPSLLDSLHMKLRCEVK
jgi:hypothetical protein